MANFSFNTYSKHLSSLINTSNLDESFVISLTGKWGTGKTTLLNLVLNDLNQKVIKVQFNAWRYTKEDAVWRGFFIAIIQSLREHLNDESAMKEKGWGETDVRICNDLIDETEKSLYTAFVHETPGEVNVDWGNFAKSGVKLGLKFIPWGELGSKWINKLFLSTDKDGNTIDKPLNNDDIDELWGVFKRNIVKREIHKIESMEQFRLSMERLLDAVLQGKYEGDRDLKPLPNDNSLYKLVVAVDDLDRCLPEHALQIFEAIKLFLNLPNTYYLLALDLNIVQHALDLRYKISNKYQTRIMAEEYIEKMINLTFQVPTLLEDNFKTFIVENLPNGKSALRIFDVINIAIPNNVRTWQRLLVKSDLLNNIIHDILPDGTEFPEEIKELFLKLQCLSYRWPTFFKSIESHLVYNLLEESVLEYYNTNGKSYPDSIEPNGFKSKSSKSKKLPKNVIDLINDINMLKFINTKPKLSSIKSPPFDLDILFSFDV